MENRQQSLQQSPQQSSFGSRSRDILMIAVISGLGGVLSTYIGYIGNTLNKLVGVPFGAGQFISGLHVYWLLMAACLVRKPGAATAAGLLKGLVEFFTGSAHGLPIVFVCLVQGIVIDLIIFLSGKKYNFPVLALAGGISALSNVVVFQILYFSGAPILYIALIAVTAFISGIIFASYLAYQSMGLLSSMRPGRYAWKQEKAAGAQEKAVSAKKKILSGISVAVTAVILLSFAGGAVYYFKNIYELPWTGVQFKVEGKVEQPYESGLKVFSDQTVSIRSELKGKVTYVPEQEYSGVPVRLLLEKAKPLADAKELKVVATDGYEVTFELEKVMSDERMLLTEDVGNETTLRLVAANYEGGYWVRKVSRFVIQ